MANQKLETDIQKMNDGRLLNGAEHIVFPLINKMITDRVNLACVNFSAGKTEFIADIAFISGLKEIEQKLKRIQNEGNQAHDKLNK